MTPAPSKAPSLPFSKQMVSRVTEPGAGPDKAAVVQGVLGEFRARFRGFRAAEPTVRALLVGGGPEAADGGVGGFEGVAPPSDGQPDLPCDRGGGTDWGGEAAPNHTVQGGLRGMDRPRMAVTTGGHLAQWSSPGGDCNATVALHC